MRYYKGIAYDVNPWSIGRGEYQDLLGMDNEPKYIVYALDVEFYCNTIQACKQGIDDWINKNGDVDTYRSNNDIPF